MLKKIFVFLNGGWERCNPPRWWDAQREMNKWRGIPSSFKFRGNAFRYKAIYKGTNAMGSSVSRFESSYKYYKKRRNKWIKKQEK